jgi:hypothetical protein
MLSSAVMLFVADYFISSSYIIIIFRHITFLADVFLHISKKIKKGKNQRNANKTTAVNVQSNMLNYKKVILILLSSIQSI